MLKKVLAAVAAIFGVGLAVVGLAVYWKMSRDPLVTLPEQVSANVVIRNVRVIDVVTGTATAARDVWLQGDRIHEIRPHRPDAKWPADAQLIAGEGLSLIPGLIDAHCHVSSSPAPPWVTEIPDTDLNLERLLFSGVTRVFDPGSGVPDIFELKEELRTGARLGPALHAAGPIFTAVGGHPVPMVRELAPGILQDRMIAAIARQVGSAEQAKVMVEALLVHKPDFLKIAIDQIPEGVPRLSPKLAKAIVSQAKANRLRAVAHIGSAQDALDAGEAGVSAWVHGVYKEEIPEPALARMAAFGIPMAPTMVVFQSYARMGRGNFEPTALERQVADAAFLRARAQRPQGYEVSKGSGAFLKMLGEQEENGLRNVRRLKARGVVILAGSDAQAATIHGPSLHRELGLLRRAGLSPLEVLRAATLYPARFLADQADPPYGVVAPEKRADLVLVRGDPLADVAAISQIEHVILGGRLLHRHPIPKG